MTSSQTPNPAQPSNGQDDEADASRGESGQVNAAAGRTSVAAPPAASSAEPPMGSSAGSSAEPPMGSSAGSPMGSSAAESPLAVPADESLGAAVRDAFTSDIKGTGIEPATAPSVLYASEQAPPARSPAAAGGSVPVNAETWLRGTSPRRLRVIDQRLRVAVWLQGVVLAAIIGLWLLGKVSWNRAPLESQRFRPLELPALTNRAQNAALQFHHDLVTGAFGQARLLVVEEGEQLVDAAAASCVSPAPCASKERVFTRATLLRASGQDARAFVESFAADGRLLAEATYDLSRSSGRWLVTERVNQ